MGSLSLAQQQAVNHDEGPMLVLGKPGTGKTTVLLRRVERLATSKSGHARVLVFSHSRMQAHHLQQSIRDKPIVAETVTVHTLDSFCTDVISNRGRAIGLDHLPMILRSDEERRQVLQAAITNNPGSLPDAPSDPTSQDRVLAKIRTAKWTLQPPEETDEITGWVHQAYNDTLRALDAIDVDDLPLLVARIFQERPRIADFYRRQYQYICIDEAQDMTDAQYVMLHALCGANYKNIMVLARDPLPNTEAGFVERFRLNFHPTVLELQGSYWSSNAVMQVASRFRRGSRSIESFPIQGDVKLIIGLNEPDEAKQVVAALQDLLHNGHPEIESPLTLDRCAIIGRHRYVLNHVQNELERYTVPFTQKFTKIFESGALKDFELWLRVLTSPHDPLHWRRLQPRWDPQWRWHPRDLSKANIRRILAEAPAHLNELVGQSVQMLLDSPSLDSFGRISALFKNYQGRRRTSEEPLLIWNDLQTWQQAWEAMKHSDPRADELIASFLNQLTLATSKLASSSGITLLTPSDAKGFAFDVVFVVGMMQGVFPMTGPMVEDQNFLIAVTRAKRVLYLSYPESRELPWGEEKPQRPSRYLTKLGLVPN